MSTPEPGRARLELLDALTAERFGVTVARCALCPWKTTRDRDDYAHSALLAHHDYYHRTELEKRRRAQLAARHGRQLVATALASSVTA